MKTILKLTIALMIGATNFVLSQQWESKGTVVAGGNGYGSDANQFKQLMSVVVDKQGNVYVPDLGNHRIQKWVPNETGGSTILGGIGQGYSVSALNLPNGVIVEDDGTIFVSDAGNSRVQMFLSGATEGITVAGGNGAGSDLNQLNFQGGIFKKGNNLYIVDAGNFRVLRWTIGDSEGVIVAGGNGYGSDLNQLGTPILNGAIYVDDMESIYITDYVNARVVKWEKGASEGVVVAGGQAGNMKNPSGIFVLEDEKILVSDYANGYWGITLWKEGELLGKIISTESGELKQPTGIFLDAQNNLYVANYGENSVKRFNYKTLSTNDLDKHNVTVYPNPVMDKLNFNSSKIINKVTIYDSNGRSVLEKSDDNIKNLDISHFTKGIYLVKIYEGSTAQTFKIIKK